MARETVNEQPVHTRNPANGVSSDASTGAEILGPPASTDEREEGAAPAFVSPQQFYRDALKREDVRRILDALAK